MTNKLLLVLIFLLILLFGSIFWLYRKNQTPQAAINNPTATPTPITLKENKISLTESGFTPSEITIKVKDGVRWVNASKEKASLNSADHPTHTKFPELNMGEFKPGETFLYVFNKPGTYFYHNHYKPDQTGKIVVAN